MENQTQHSLGVLWLLSGIVLKIEAGGI